MQTRGKIVACAASLVSLALLAKKAGFLWGCVAAAGRAISSGASSSAGAVGRLLRWEGGSTSGDRGAGDSEVLSLGDFDAALRQRARDGSSGDPRDGGHGGGRRATPRAGAGQTGREGGANGPGWPTYSPPAGATEEEAAEAEAEAEAVAEAVAEAEQSSRKAPPRVGSPEEGGDCASCRRKDPPAPASLSASQNLWLLPPVSLRAPRQQAPGAVDFSSPKKDVPGKRIRALIRKLEKCTHRGRGLGLASGWPPPETTPEGGR